MSDIINFIKLAWNSFISMLIGALYIIGFIAVIVFLFWLDRVRFFY